MQTKLNLKQLTFDFIISFTDEIRKSIQSKNLQEAKLLSLNIIPTKPGIKAGEILYNKTTLIIILGPYHYTSIFSSKSIHFFLIITYGFITSWLMEYPRPWASVPHGRLLGVSVYSHSWLSQVFTL